VCECVFFFSSSPLCPSPPSLYSSEHPSNQPPPPLPVPVAFSLFQVLRRRGEPRRLFPPSLLPKLVQDEELSSPQAADGGQYAKERGGKQGREGSLTLMVWCWVEEEVSEEELEEEEGDESGSELSDEPQPAGRGVEGKRGKGGKEESLQAREKHEVERMRKMVEDETRREEEERQKEKERREEEDKKVSKQGADTNPTAGRVSFHPDTVERPSAPRVAPWSLPPSSSPPGQRRQLTGIDQSGKQKRPPSYASRQHDSTRPSSSSTSSRRAGRRGRSDRRQPRRGSKRPSSTSSSSSSSVPHRSRPPAQLAAPIELVTVLRKGSRAYSARTVELSQLPAKDGVTLLLLPDSSLALAFTSEKPLGGENRSFTGGTSASGSSSSLPPSAPYSTMVHFSNFKAQTNRW